MKIENNWPANITYWDKISEKTVDLVVSQTEKLLKETIISAQSLQEKLDKLTAILVPSLSAIAIYLFTQKGQWYDYINLTAFFLAVVLLLSLIVLFSKNNTYTIRPEGSYPEIYLNNTFINATDTTARQYLQIALQVCKEYKDKIEKNKTLNTDFTKRYKTALRILVIGLPLSIVLAFILNQYLVCYLWLK